MKENILICPKWTKKKRQLCSFFEGLSIYEGEKVSIVFKDNIFEETIDDFKSFYDEYKVIFEKIIFENVTFQKYVRFDNIKCTNLEFIDVHFEKGGGIKNRGERNGLNIDTLVFRPFTMTNDFVIDMGYYANSEGFLETNKIGRIRSIEFENHKDGNGQIYFVGINEQTEEANFRNKILDHVSFQNSDLSNCYFLNAKIDKTDFTNCLFPEIKNHAFVNRLYGLNEAIIFSTFPFSMLVFFLLMANVFLLNQSWLFAIYLLILPMMIILFLASFNAFMHPIEYMLSFQLTKKSDNILNKVKNFHYHFGTRDEKEVNEILRILRGDKNQDYMALRSKLQQSYFSLIELYRQLKENFDKSDFQTAGNFFYSQRYMEMITSTHKKSWLESFILNIHYLINGFGERFLRPIILVILTAISFIWLFIVVEIEPNRDFISTGSTPLFLVKDINATDDQLFSLPRRIDINDSLSTIDISGQKGKNPYYLDGKRMDSNISSQYVYRLKEDWHTLFYYSLSHFNLPFTSENRQWFKEVSQRAVLLGYIESVLLWLFSGAFILALFHRIKR